MTEQPTMTTAMTLADLFSEIERLCEGRLDVIQHTTRSLIGRFRGKASAYELFSSLNDHGALGMALFTFPAGEWRGADDDTVQYETFQTEGPLTWGHWSNLIGAICARELGAGSLYEHPRVLFIVSAGPQEAAVAPEPEPVAVTHDTATYGAQTQVAQE